MVVAEIACGQTAIIFDHSLFSKNMFRYKRYESLFKHDGCGGRLRSDGHHGRFIINR